jgi:bifunctional DNase/RNase
MQPVAQAAESSPGTSEQVTISDVKVRMSDHGPVVLLQAEGKAIPIFVDVTVAVSIQGALNGERLSRPMSHDLMHTILDAYGGKVLQTVITLKDGTYYGALTVAVQDQVKVFDSRSSDSIALALLFGHPFFQSCEAFFGGLLNEGHILSEVLFGVDFAFLSPLLLVQPELGDHGAVFLVERFPDRFTFGLQKNRVLVTGWVGCPYRAPPRSQQDESQRQYSHRPPTRRMNGSSSFSAR